VQEPPPDDFDFPRRFGGGFDGGFRGERVPNPGILRMGPFEKKEDSKNIIRIFPGEKPDEKKSILSYPSGTPGILDSYNLKSGASQPLLPLPGSTPLLPLPGSTSQPLLPFTPTFSGEGMSGDTRGGPGGSRGDSYDEFEGPRRRNSPGRRMRRRSRTPPRGGRRPGRFEREQPPHFRGENRFGSNDFQQGMLGQQGLQGQQGMQGQQGWQGFQGTQGQGWQWQQGWQGQGQGWQGQQSTQAPNQGQGQAQQSTQGQQGQQNQDQGNQGGQLSGVQGQESQGW